MPESPAPHQTCLCNMAEREGEKPRERGIAPTCGQLPRPAFGSHAASPAADAGVGLAGGGGGAFFFLSSRSFSSFFAPPLPLSSPSPAHTHTLPFSQSRLAISPALSVWTPSHMRTGGSPPLFNISAPPKKSLQRSITAGGDPDSRHRGRDGPGRGGQPPPGCGTAAGGQPGGVRAGEICAPAGAGVGGGRNYTFFCPFLSFLIFFFF